MLIAIDGSDSATNRHSISPRCSNFSVFNFKNDYLGPGKAYYHDGPTLDGSGVNAIRTKALKFVEDNYVEDEPINMIGFSRGGLIVADIAQALNAGGFVWPPEESKQRSAIAVNFLGLYDAVNRTLWQYRTSIPGNVAYVYHARRDPSIGSRWYFGSTATKPDSGKTVYTEKFFFSTHAGMGGDYNGGDRIDHSPMLLYPSPLLLFTYMRGDRVPGPWNAYQRMTVAEAQSGSIAADTWMRQNAIGHGIILASATCHL